MLNFTDKLERIMMITELNQSELADELEISQTYVSALLSSRRAPSLKLEKRIKKTFGISDEDWAGNDEFMISSEYFMEREDDERYYRLKSAMSTIYCQEVIPISDFIQNSVKDMSQLDRIKVTAKIIASIEKIMREFSR
jgi:transcriptional regulator with XRE-family HTH domain